MLNLRLQMFDGAARRRRKDGEDASGLASRFISDAETIERITVSLLDTGSMLLRRVRVRARRTRPAGASDRGGRGADAGRHLVCHQANAGAGRRGRATPPGRAGTHEQLDRSRTRQPRRSPSERSSSVLPPNACSRRRSASAGSKRQTGRDRADWPSSGRSPSSSRQPSPATTGRHTDLPLPARPADVLGFRRPGRPQPRHAERPRRSRPLLRAHRHPSRYQAGAEDSKRSPHSRPDRKEMTTPACEPAAFFCRVRRRHDLEWVWTARWEALRMEVEG